MHAILGGNEIVLWPSTEEPRKRTGVGMPRPRPMNARLPDGRDGNQLFGGGRKFMHFVDVTIHN